MLAAFAGAACCAQTPAAPVAPKVVSTFPARGASSVGVKTSITVSFSQAMNAASINGSTFTLTGPGEAAVSGVVSYLPRTATFKPSGALECGALYTAIITTGAKSASGIALKADFAWSFSAITSDERADALEKQMTQNEKIQMVMGGVKTNLTYGYTVPRGAGGYMPGIPRLGIPELYYEDGSVGLASATDPGTALPSSLASAAGFDMTEAYKYGQLIGTETADYGINVNAGGNINLIGREPRDGRTFETKGEDPILAGKICAAHVAGVQSAHIIGDVKHFAFNDQETGRTTANAVISERGGRESDLLAFEIAIKDSNVQSVMCSYNQTNSVYDCQNKDLLKEVLKNDWAFPGFVMSDFWATHSTAEAANNGLDQEQPNQQYFSLLGQAIDDGEVPQSRLNDMVHRILRAMFQVGLFDYPQKIQPIAADADAALAKETEELGAVLLKNRGQQLPLEASTVKSIAVIGSHADVGVLSGGGSAQVWPVGYISEGACTFRPGSPCPNPPEWAQVVWDPSSPLNAIRAKAPHATVGFADGSDTAVAAQLAASSQVAIVVVNQWGSEGMDRPTLRLVDFADKTPIDQDALVAAVAKANPHTIVVAVTDGPILMPWLNQVSAVLEAWFPGQQGAEAIADLLFGTANPSGKLPVTFPASDSQLPRPQIPQPPDSTTPFDVNYFEGYNVGYKWFEAQKLTPLFPFGFGLSYTTFSITDADLENNLTSRTNPNFQVTYQVENTGARAGAEVAQVYLGLPESTDEPRRLAGWQKTMLQPGDSQAVTIEVDENDSSHPLSYWDETAKNWQVAPGTYTVYLGTSSRASDLKVVGTITVRQ
jgi:beta-glucosidase